MKKCKACACVYCLNWNYAKGNDLNFDCTTFFPIYTLIIFDEDEIQLPSLAPTIKQKVCLNCGKIVETHTIGDWYCSTKNGCG